MATPKKGTIHLGRGVTVTPPKPGNNDWRVRWKEPGQTGWPERTAKTQELAVEIGTAIASRLGGGFTAEDGDRTVGELARNYLAHLAQDPSKAAYLRRQTNIIDKHVLPARTSTGRKMEDVTVARWSGADCLDVMARARGNGLAASTLQNVGSTMRSLVTRAHMLRWLPRTEDPMAGVKYAVAGSIQGAATEYIPRDSLPTDTDVLLLVKGFHVTDYPRLSVMAQLISQGGPRWGESIALRPMDIDFERREISITRSVDEDDDFRVKAPKNNKRRTTIFAPSLAGPLRDLCEVVRESEGPDGLLFPGPDGRFMRRTYGRRRFIRAAAAGGWETIPNSTKLPSTRWLWHDLRHYAACWMLFDVGLDVAKVSRFLGHHSTSFTWNRYVGVRGDAVADALTLTEAF